MAISCGARGTGGLPANVASGWPGLTCRQRAYGVSRARCPARCVVCEAAFGGGLLRTLAGFRCSVQGAEEGRCPVAYVEFADPAPHRAHPASGLGRRHCSRAHDNVLHALDIVRVDQKSAAELVGRAGELAEYQRTGVIVATDTRRIPWPPGSCRPVATSPASRPRRGTGRPFPRPGMSGAGSE